MKQLDFFHLLDDQASEFICDTCLFDINGCCSFDEPLGRYCTLGDSKIDFHEKYRGDGRLTGKTKNNTVDIYLDQYPEDVFNGEKFIGVCIDRRDKLGGFGCGCSTVKEVIDLIQKKEADNETN